MSLSTRELNQLKKIVLLASNLIAKAEAAEAAGSTKSSGAKQKTTQSAKRTRRTGAELAKFRKMLVAERKKGTSVADLSKQHGVSPAYIYQL